MGKRKHSRSRSKDKETEELRKRLKKLEKKIKERDYGEREKENRRPPSPGTPPLPSKTTDEIEELAGDDIPEELLLALGKEGEEAEVVGEDLQHQLVNRWTNIIHQGLGKEARESLLKKYPTPANFPSAVPPKMNPEIQASLSEATVKRDKRIVVRQATIGKIMTAVGRALSNVLTGNLNTKELVEQLNDSAKLAAEVYHQDSTSRKIFALAGTSTVVKDAVKNGKTDDYLFGKSCGDQIKAAQAIQRQAFQIKTVPRQENWKSPLQGPPHYRSGQPLYRPPVKTRYTQPTQRTQLSQRIQSAPRTQTARKKPVQPQKPVQSRYRRY